jgi:hypothetical protein
MMSLTVLTGPPGRPEQVTDSAASAEPVVTITVQITMVGDELPPAASRLLTDLEALVASQPVTRADPAPALRLVPPQPAGAADALDPAESDSAPTPVRRIGQHDEATPLLTVCKSSRLVLRDGTPLRLTRREYELFEFFCDNPRRVFTRAHLLRQVWGYDMVGTERTVDVHVRRLRAKLGGCAAIISTVRGVGYRLDDSAPVAILVQPD